MPDKPGRRQGPGKRMQPIDRLVGQRVRMLRIARGMSQAALASRIGKTFQQVQKYEWGTNRISASVLYLIADTLRVPIIRLFEDTKGADALSMGQDQTSPIPSLADLQALTKLSQIRNERLKNIIVDLIWVLAGKEPPDRKDE